MISRSVLINFVLVLLAASALANPAPIRNDKPDEYLQMVNDATARTGFDILDNLNDFIRRNDMSLNLPVANTQVTISSRNLHNDEVDFKVKFSDGSSPNESRKSKLKKLAIPLLTFVLLKAITLVPLLLGVLGIKALSALKLSFFSFVISIALAVFQLCKKLSDNHHHHPEIAAGPWIARSIVDVPEYNEPAQDIAYNAYKS